MTDEKKRFEILQELQEHMDQKFDIIAEGYQVLRKDIEETRKEARELNRITNQKIDFIAANLSNKIAGNREEIVKNREEIGKNREEIGKNREAIDKNGKRIDEHDRKLGRFIEKTEVHDQRIERLELV